MHETFRTLASVLFAAALALAQTACGIESTEEGELVSWDDGKADGTTRIHVDVAATDANGTYEIRFYDADTLRDVVFGEAGAVNVELLARDRLSAARDVVLSGRVEVPARTTRPRFSLPSATIEDGYARMTAMCTYDEASDGRSELQVVVSAGIGSAAITDMLKIAEFTCCY